MAKRILSIVESAYRATLEEQDDTVVWLMHAIEAAGAQVIVVLRGGAVNYLARDQDASGLAFGDRRQTRPPRVQDDLVQLARRGVEVLALAEDVAARGLDEGCIIDGVRLVPHAALTDLIRTHDQVWHW